MNLFSIISIQATKMSQRIVMSFVLQQFLKELGPRISNEQKEKIENQVDSKLARVLGNDWTRLPVTGPRMMILVIILNAVLLPFGIAPSILADIAIKKGKSYEVDQKFVRLLENAKGDFSKQRIEEFSKYTGKTFSFFSAIISESIETTKAISAQGKDIVTYLVKKGKTALSKNDMTKENT
jgi:hypothetical protein